MSDYHGRTMNIPLPTSGREHSFMYKTGHRDARHAAAEIANDADAEIGRLQNVIGHAVGLLNTGHAAEALDVLRLADTNAPANRVTDQPDAVHPLMLDGVIHHSACAALHTPAFHVARRACTCGAAPPTDQMDCRNCHMCLRGVKVEFWNGVSLPVAATRMIVCPDCGNKRCPKASAHRLACTGSNEPGQPGSIYTRATDPTSGGQS